MTQGRRFIIHLQDNLFTKIKCEHKTKTTIKVFFNKFLKKYFICFFKVSLIYNIYIYGMGLRLFQVQHFAHLSLIQYRGSTEHRLELILISFLSRTTKNNKKENWATNLCSVDNQFSNEELHIEGVWSATFHFVVQESHPSRHFFRWDTLIQSRQGEIINFRFYRWKQLC